MSEHREIEQRCLDEVTRAIGSGEELAEKSATRVDRVYLDGEYPETRIVAVGEHTYGGSWRASFPIWDPAAGGTRDGQPRPEFVGTLMLSEILEA